MVIATCKSLKEASAQWLVKEAFEDGFEEPLLAYLLKKILDSVDEFHGDCKVNMRNVFVDVETGNVIVHSDVESDEETPKRGEIWFFGMVALELAHGLAPFAAYEPMELLKMSMMNDYCLDYNKKFSKSFRTLLGSSLLLKKIPTASELSTHTFFDTACSKELFVSEIAKKLSPNIKVKKPANISFGSREERSQMRYLEAPKTWKSDLKSFVIPEDELDIWDLDSSEEGCDGEAKQHQTVLTDDHDWIGKSKKLKDVLADCA